MNSAVFSQDWRSMKTALSRPCSLMATLTVVTALPAPVVNLSSGSAVKRPVMVTVFMVIPLLWVLLEREGSGETSERQGCPQGRGEVLAGPVTVSERSKRRQKLSAALTPDGPVHHLKSSQPQPREGHRTPRTPAGQLSWLASCPPPACRDRRPRSVDRWPWAGTRQGAGDSSGMSRASLCPGKRRIAPA